MMKTLSGAFMHYEELNSTSRLYQHALVQKLNVQLQKWILNLQLSALFRAPTLFFLPSHLLFFNHKARIRISLMSDDFIPRLSDCLSGLFTLAVSIWLSLASVSDLTARDAG